MSELFAVHQISSPVCIPAVESQPVFLPAPYSILYESLSRRPCSWKL